MFQQYDLNLDGVLTIPEIRRGAILARIRQYDSNNDGKVDKQDVLFTKNPAFAEFVLTRFDSDHDNALTLKDGLRSKQARPLLRAVVKNALKHFDENGDKRISFEEFIESMNPNLRV